MGAAQKTFNGLVDNFPEPDAFAEGVFYESLVSMERPQIREKKEKVRP
jgi:hypothetical protein